MSRSLTALLTAASLAAFSIPATAQLVAPCGDRGAILAFLFTSFSERSVASGISVNGGLLVELFISSPSRDIAGNTFTLVVTNPASNQACMILGGSSWTSLLPGTNIGGRND